METGVIAGVVTIGIVHGVLPDHGWPIAATYALARHRIWVYGTVAGLILGVGHLISSVALVIAYYWVSGFATVAEGPWLGYVAGVTLVVLGLREYRTGGHGHGDAGHQHDHETADANHQHDHETAGSGHGHDNDGGEETTDGLLSRLWRRLSGGREHRHLDEDDADRGLLGLGATALVLGFAHEEPIQILAICVGTPFCLELMVVYSLAVIVAILVPTLLLIAGYERHRDTVEKYTPYLPQLTAVVLVGMGLAFIAGIF